jgi:hypothetical protein
MPITVKHRPVGSEVSLAQAASFAGAQDWWSQLAKSGLTAAEIYEGRRRQERGIEAQQASQELAAEIRSRERGEIRGEAEERERELAESVEFETGIAPFPGEAPAGFMARMEPEVAIGREGRVATALQERKRNDLQKQLAVVESYPGITEDEKQFHVSRLQRQIAGLPPEKQPPNPADLYRGRTYTDPQSGAVIGFKDNGEPFKLLDRPKEPDGGTQALTGFKDFGDYNKQMQAAMKDLIEEAKSGAGEMGEWKIPTQQQAHDLVMERMKLFGGLFPKPIAPPGFERPVPAPPTEIPGELPPAAAPAGAAAGVPDIVGPEPLSVMDPRVKERMGEAGLEPGDAGIFWGKRPPQIATQEQFVAWVRKEKPRVLARIKEPDYARVSKKLRARGMSALEVQDRVMEQVLADEELDAAMTGDPVRYKVLRDAYFERFGKE